MQQSFYGGENANPSDVHHNAHIICVLGISDPSNQRCEQLGSMSSSLSSLATMSNIVWPSLRLPLDVSHNTLQYCSLSDETTKDIALG